MNLNPVFAADAARHEREWGIVTPYALDYLPPEYKFNFDMAMDAQPTLVTAPNAGIPAWFTSFVDPEVIRILQTPNKGAQILGEQKKGSFVDETAFFPVIENTGEVSTYGDFNANGRSSANASFVQRQAYRFQTTIEYGDLEVERAGAAKLNWISELQTSGAKTLDKFMDYVYHFGTQGLNNYGITNDPYLSAALTPASKAYGGVKWVNNGALVATANEVMTDFQAMFLELQVQSGGLVDEDSKLVLVLPNTVSVAMSATNAFGITARQMIKESFPNVEVIVDPRYNLASGNLVQLIAKEVDGKNTGYCAFSEKQRDHRLIPYESSYRQKKSAASWGAIMRYPLAVAQLLGV